MFFKNIIGQPEVKVRMLKSVAENRVSHAQLIFGHEGGGALPLAVAYAQYIHCTNRNEKDSCGECPSCQKYSKLVHPDLHFVFPIKNSDKTPVSDFFIYKFREIFLENPYFTYDDWGQKIDAENKQLI